MSIIDQYLLIAFVFTVEYAIVTMQVIALRRRLRSWAWTLIATAFLLSGARLVWGLIRLPAGIMNAQAQGWKMPASLTVEQWIQIAVAEIVAILLMCGFYKLKKDLSFAERWKRPAVGGASAP